MLCRTRNKVRLETLERRLVAVRVAAEILGCGPDFVRHQFLKGALPFVRCGRKVMVDLRDLEQFIQRNKEVASLAGLAE